MTAGELTSIRKIELRESAEGNHFEFILIGKWKDLETSENVLFE